MNVYTVTHVEHGCILEFFSSEKYAKDYINWYSRRCRIPKDFLIIQSHKLHDCFTKEDFE